MSIKCFHKIAGLFLLLTLAPTNTSADVIVKAFGQLKTYPSHSLATQVIALRKSDIGSLLNANIIMINFEEGEKIKKGRWLIKLDCFNSEMQLEQQKTSRELNNLDIAWEKKELVRIKKLVAKKHLPQANLDAKQRVLEAKLIEKKQLKIKLEQAQKEVERCTLYAPYNGTILKRHANIGEFATIGKTLVTLIDTKNTLVEVNVPFSLVEDFRTASSHWLENDNKQIPLTVEAIMPQVNIANNSQTFRLKTDSPLLVGEQSRIWWQSSTPQIDGKYLHRHDGKLGIWVEETTGKYLFISMPKAQEGRALNLLLKDSVNVVTENVHLITP